MDKDLNEASLAEALAAIRFDDESALRRTAKPTKLIVTSEGVALTRHRYATEPDFRAIVQELAARDPAYRKLCEDVGLVLSLSMGPEATSTAE